jgi:phage/plasmid-like protein (TIGR03299 family)
MANTDQRDVNAEFRQSKMDQITSALDGAKNARDRAEKLREKVASDVASGAMTDLGNGLYRVNTGWDAGETLRLRTDLPTLDENEIKNAITGAHGLDTTADGRTALYVAGEPAWHSLGTHFTEPLTSVDAVLKASGLDWGVIKTPQGGINPVTGEFEEAGPDLFHTRRDDLGTVLGAVGKIYHPLTNREGFEFLEGLFHGYEFRPVSAGSFREGRRVFITAELPDEMIVDPNGFADHIRQFVAILNSHDGSSPITAIATPWRIECANTERFAMRDAKHKWTIRHTKSAKDKLAQASKTLGLTTQYYHAWQEEEMALVADPFHDNEIDALCDLVWGEKPDANEASKRAVTLDTDRRDKVRDVFRMERDRVGSNAYAAERAVTGYVDHFQSLRPRGVLKGNRLGALAQGIMEETLDEPKHKAHKVLMERVNR